MKFRYVFISSIIAFATLYSCTKEYTEPVETCTFIEPTGNATNPYTDIYQEILDEYVALGMPGISVAIETPEHGWWVGSAGMASIEEQIPMLPCHLQHSESQAKTYIATLIMRLVEEGVIGLDDTFGDYLPDNVVSRIANADAATIRQLLNHTSGLPEPTQGILSGIDILNDPDLWKTTEFLFEKYIYGKPAIAEPGEKFLYSNVNYCLLGIIVEDASGMSLGEYFDQEITESLGLANTFYRASSGYPDQIPNTVSSYFEIFPGELQNCSDIDFMRAEAVIGADGLLATPYELALFYRELLRGNILDPTTVATMLEEENMLVDGVYYGLGIEHLRPSELGGIYMSVGDGYGHAGVGYGSLGRTFYFPDTEICISLQINLGIAFPSDNTRRFDPMIEDLLSVAFSGKRQ